MWSREWSTTSHSGISYSWAGVGHEERSVLTSLCTIWLSDVWSKGSKALLESPCTKWRITIPNTVTFLQELQHSHLKWKGFCVVVDISADTSTALNWKVGDFCLIRVVAVQISWVFNRSKYAWKVQIYFEIGFQLQTECDCWVVPFADWTCLKASSLLL